MNTLAAFDRDRADVTARVSFALGSVLARVALETEQCRRALADAEATSYTDEETGNTAENPEAARLRVKLDALEALNERCILAGGALSAAWAQESRQSEMHVSDALHRCRAHPRGAGHRLSGYTDAGPRRRGRAQKGLPCAGQGEPHLGPRRIPLRVL